MTARSSATKATRRKYDQIFRSAVIERIRFQTQAFATEHPPSSTRVPSRRIPSRGLDSCRPFHHLGMPSPRHHEIKARSTPPSNLSLTNFYPSKSVGNPQIPHPETPNPSSPPQSLTKWHDQKDKDAGEREDTYDGILSTWNSTPSRERTNISP